MNNKRFFVKFDEIDQFRTVVKNLTQAQFIGIDENGEKMYDRTLPRPVVKFKGTVKLHGTNAGVVWHNGELHAQSRNNIITPENDNAGFASFVKDNKDCFTDLFMEIRKREDLDANDARAIAVFGEWAGDGIMKGVAISNIPKSFFIFGICLVDLENQDEDNDFNREWLDCSNYRHLENKIYNINDYQTWDIEIDFNNPGEKQNELIDITMKIEEECPVAKAFGYSGVGEGATYYGYHKGKRYIFKVKGEKHSISKVKTLAAVDVEKLASINDFCDYAVTENRLDQAIDNVFGKDLLDIKKMGDVIRWIVGDINKEESDVLEENNLTDKDVNKHLSDRTRIMFGERLNKQSGLN